MSVLACSRSSCSNVTNVGYVCYECQDEFKVYLELNNITPATDVEIENELKVFLSIDKGKFKKGTKISVDEFFSKATR